MKFIDKIFEHPKLIGAIAGAATVSILGYFTFKYLSKPEQIPKEKEQTPIIPKESKISLKEYENQELLMKLSYPSDFIVGDVISKESGCYILHLHHPTKEGTKISIICEYVDPNITLEKFYQESLDHLNTIVISGISNVKKVNETIGEFPAIFLEYSVSNFKLKKRHNPRNIKVCFFDSKTGLKGIFK
jgi:hypothetical protein